MTSNNDDTEESPFARTPADVLREAGFESEADPIEQELRNQKVHARKDQPPDAEQA